MGEFYRRDIANLLGSGGRGILARRDDIATAVQKLDDFVDLTTLDPKTNWVDLGAARRGQGRTYSRNMTTSEGQIEEDTGAVWTDVDDIPRQMTMQFAEITPENAQIIEDALDPVAIAAAAHRSPQTAVDFGTVESLTAYRLVLVGMRRTGQGQDITDEDGDKRGPLVAVCLHNVSISADNADLELQRGQIANVPLTFKAYPDPGISDARKAVGRWLFEDGPATIAAV